MHDCNDWPVSFLAAMYAGIVPVVKKARDAGVLVIGDTRLVTKGYGRQLLAALPSMRRLQSEPEFLEALDALTRASTTDRSCP